ncbi:MAG: hypothetical protein ABIS86_23240 [Streptosporangiaceae bacterium]
MRRTATVVLTTGALLLSTGTFAVTGAQATPLAAPATPTKVAAAPGSGTWTTKNGSSKLFKTIQAKGSYKVNRDRITVHFQLKDTRKNGWTPAVQFATSEAWDIQDSGVFYVINKARKNGRSTVPDEGATLEGPPIKPRAPNNPHKQTCTRCVHKKPKKPKKKVKTGPADGRFTFKSKKAFTSEFTEYLFVREVLLRKKGKKYQFKNGPITVIYNSDAKGSNTRTTADTSRTRTALTRKLPASGLRKAVPGNYVYYNSRKNPTRAGNRPGQLPYLDSWGWFHGRTVSGRGAAEINVKIRDNIRDGRLAAVYLDFYNADGTQGEEHVIWNTSDVRGRWGSLKIHSFFTGHLLYTACTGTQKRNSDGSHSFTRADCGKTLVAY